MGAATKGRSQPAFRWNAAGWFGGQLGASLWILLLGLLLCLQGAGVGFAVLLCGLVANAVGVVLWRRRERLAAYTALQILVGVTGLMALVALALATWLGPGGDPGDPLAQTPAWSLLFYPALMGAFWLQERLARRRAAS